MDGCYLKAIATEQNKENFPYVVCENGGIPHPPCIIWLPRHKER